ncbi:MAG: type II toxin-antitoxin system RelE/ParE family toxin [Patescibacteria group bacterium]|nr:type II toxin-antitoxin system RelE/ParE family toxin [Patescibacteria group bacterium]
MEYKLIYSKTAVKDIKKLDLVMRKRLKKKLELFVKDPKKYAKKLQFFQLGNYRFRVGKLRVVFDFQTKAIQVLRVGFRGDIYKK